MVSERVDHGSKACFPGAWVNPWEQRQKKVGPTFRVGQSWLLFANFRSTLTVRKWKNPTLTLKVEWGEKFSNFNFSNFFFWT
jgi:hypothetical protein